ncbi:GFA family protein [Roseobacter ponti]|uniref:GFA family protein n=1 Tax=Roseobacter ponti TaxID=1891787 RepID=A0A858SQB1_9RHOB|nr:GFA family protein [Roseobacter ponti]QJF49883.1 GFA family protein [Roseobacter ponti]
MPRTGSCLCGAVTYEISADVSQTGACHCGMCRKWSGGVYLGVEVPDGGLQITGEDHLKTYASSPWAERVFCGTCGSSMWYRMTATGSHQGTYHLGFGTLDDTDGMEMMGEIFIDKKPEAYSFAGDAQRMTEAEFMALFGGS